MNPNPITIDLTGLKGQFGLDDNTINQLTETCVNAVSTAIVAKWEELARNELHATQEEYIQNIIRVDKGRFNKQIVLTGVVPNMVEQGASAFDIKEGFKKSTKVKYTIPRYGKKGKMIYAGGDWYLTIPFRIGVPGTMGQAGFTGQMPQAVYNVMKKRANRIQLTLGEIPTPYDQRLTRAPIAATATTPYYAAYQHKNSIYEGLTKRTAQYAKTLQNTYGTFRRAGANSDPLSWIHKGIKAHNFAIRAVDAVDIDTIVENEVTMCLETIV